MIHVVHPPYIKTYPDVPDQFNIPLCPSLEKAWRQISFAGRRYLSREAMFSNPKKETGPSRFLTR
jgi:hypothetical protein